MKGLTITVLSLAVAASTVLAGSKNQIPTSRPADPEGQYPRLGACPDPHACIFPPDVYVLSFAILMFDINALTN